ncbi:hypothetical protein ACLOJK_005349 [Asimina triloba]
MPASFTWGRKEGWEAAGRGGAGQASVLFQLVEGVDCSSHHSPASWSERSDEHRSRSSWALPAWPGHWPALRSQKTQNRNAFALPPSPPFRFSTLYTPLGLSTTSVPVPVRDRHRSRITPHLDTVTDTHTDTDKILPCCSPTNTRLREKTEK